jgi:hypothetical protein
MVLPEMLKPGCDHEGLEEASFFGRILEDVPSVRAVPPALLTQMPDGDEERVTFLGGDAVLDRYQHRTTVGIGVDRQDRRRPMHGGREVHSRTGQKLPVPSRRDSDESAGGRDEVRRRRQTSDSLLERRVKKPRGAFQRRANVGVCRHPMRIAQATQVIRHDAVAIRQSAVKSLGCS